MGCGCNKNKKTQQVAQARTEARRTLKQQATKPVKRTVGTQRVRTK